MLLGLPYYLLVVIPFVGSLLIPVMGRINERLRDWTPAIFMGVTMILAWSLLGDFDHASGTTSWTWIEVLGINFEVLLDPLSIIMTILASTLCFLIYVYSTEYMAGDEDRDRFFFLMLAFGGGMITLVISANLLIAFVGWEIMGFCSYGLIGFWNDRKNAPELDPEGVESNNPLLQFETEGEYNTHCGTKAFIVTRIGDAFMLVGILLLFIFAGTFSFIDLANPEMVSPLSSDPVHPLNWWQVLFGSGLLLPVLGFIFMGAIGKSGQFPLQVWLPEAMAGPTSVSALIHAATMVKAGVYITARFLVTIVGVTSGPDSDHQLLLPLQAVGIEVAFTFFMIVAVIGALTAFMTATMGMVSNELKQILAFSTLSQLGYMILALGAGGLLGAHYEGAYLSSVLHVISHGAFKALLFLAAGGVIHAVHTKYISNMGGLKEYMPWTYRVMLIGVAALAGIPPLSGFWSKDSIIEWVYDYYNVSHDPIGLILFALAVGAAVCTIFYSLRLIGMVFHGPSKKYLNDHDLHADTSHDDKEEAHDSHGKPQDPGPAMMIPLYVLAAFTLGELLVIPAVQNLVLRTSDSWGVIMFQIIQAKLTMPGLVPFAITMASLLVGGFSGWWIYIKNADTPNQTIPENGIRRKLYNFLKRRWLINDFYYWILDNFIRGADWYRMRVDNNIIDGIDFESRDAAISISSKLRWFDENVVDGLAEGISTQSVAASESGQAIQTGRVNDYISVMIFGIGIMAILVLVSLGLI